MKGRNKRVTDKERVIRWCVTNTWLPVYMQDNAHLPFIGQRLHGYRERGERARFSFDRGRFEVSRSTRLDVRSASWHVAWPRRRNREYLLRNWTNPDRLPVNPGKRNTWIIPTRCHLMAIHEIITFVLESIFRFERIFRNQSSAFFLKNRNNTYLWKYQIIFYMIFFNK